MQYNLFTRYDFPFFQDSLSIHLDSFIVFSRSVRHVPFFQAFSLHLPFPFRT